MHVLIASAGHTATPWHIGHVAAIITAAVVGALIILLFKVAVRILSPRKKGTRPGLPYAAAAKRK